MAGYPLGPSGSQRPRLTQVLWRKREKLKSPERASAENDLDCGSDALRDRDHLALIAGLPVRFRESDGWSIKQPATLTTRKKDCGTTLMRTPNDT